MVKGKLGWKKRWIVLIRHKKFGSLSCYKSNGGKEEFVIDLRHVILLKKEDKHQFTIQTSEKLWKMKPVDFTKLIQHKWGSVIANFAINAKLIGFTRKNLPVLKSSESLPKVRTYSFDSRPKEYVRDSQIDEIFKRHQLRKKEDEQDEDEDLNNQLSNLENELLPDEIRLAKLLSSTNERGEFINQSSPRKPLNNPLTKRKVYTSPTTTTTTRKPLNNPLSSSTTIKSINNPLSSPDTRTRSKILSKPQQSYTSTTSTTSTTRKPLNNPLTTRKPLNNPLSSPDRTTRSKILSKPQQSYTSTTSTREPLNNPLKSTTTTKSYTSPTSMTKSYTSPTSITKSYTSPTSTTKSYTSTTSTRKPLNNPLSSPNRTTTKSYTSPTSTTKSYTSTTSTRKPLNNPLSSSDRTTTKSYTSTTSTRKPLNNPLSSPERTTTKSYTSPTSTRKPFNNPLKSTTTTKSYTSPTTTRSKILSKPQQSSFYNPEREESSSKISKLVKKNVQKLPQVYETSYQREQRLQKEEQEKMSKFMEMARKESGSEIDQSEIYLRYLLSGGQDTGSQITEEEKRKSGYETSFEKEQRLKKLREEKLLKLYERHHT